MKTAFIIGITGQDGAYLAEFKGTFTFNYFLHLGVDKERSFGFEKNVKWF